MFGLLLGGILFTLRGRLWAGYWLATSIGLTILLAIVHFVGFEPGSAETPHVIARTYPGPIGGGLALMVLFGQFVISIAVAIHAVRVRRLSGRW